MISPKYILSFLIFILAAHFLATIYSWYWTYTWLDMPMHFLGGLWVAAVFFCYINPKLQITNCKLLITLISALGFVALIGVLWEFFEFLCDVFISSKGYIAVSQLGAADTIGDLFFDFVGGLVFLVIYKFYLNKKSHLG